MSDWSPRDYLKFADERSRPAMDLLQRVPSTNPSLVYDLGCGPGNSTALLRSRFPDAEIIGLDNSPAMIEAARLTVPSAQFELADLNDWSPPRHADVLFSNATLQWIPNHLALMQRLLDGLLPQGVLAVQMPDNLAEPSHALMRDVALAGPWSEKLKAADVARAAIASPQDYYDALKPCAAKLEIWHSIYNHPLAGADAIVALFRTTGLKPYLDPLTNAEQVAFLTDYRKGIAKAYPQGVDGNCLLRFPRLFIVAVK